MKLKYFLVFFLIVASLLLLIYFVNNDQNKFNNNNDQNKPNNKNNYTAKQKFANSSKKTLPVTNNEHNLIIADSIKIIQDTNSNLVKGEIVKHDYYMLSYSEEHEQAYWVRYILTRSMLENPLTSRKDNFRTDPLISTGSAELADYVGSGFDRGHLCPAKDMECSDIAMSESFYMSNMSPQHPSLNRGRWKQLEGQVRKWSLKYDSLIIYCGGVLDSISSYIGPNNVVVPKFYYKVIFSTQKNEAISFIMPNKKCENKLIYYSTTVDSVEKLTHIDFFEQYPSELQKVFESKNNFNQW